MQAIAPRHDLDALRRHITVPAGIERAEWVIAPRGVASAAPGPTDLMLLARFPLDAATYDALRPALGPSRGEQRVAIDPRLGAAVGGAESVAGALHGAGPFETSGWRGGWALWDGEGLVVMVFSQ